MAEPVRIRQLEALNAVAEHGSMTNAAEALGISQPAVSRLLSDLAKDLGFQLFHRKDGRLNLTQEARFLLPEIRRVLESMAHIAEAGRNLSTRNAGHLRIACLPGFATSHLPHVVAEFVKDRPGITVTIEPDRPERILEWIVTEQYDCGITDSFDGHPAIESHSVDIRTVCIFPSDHPLSQREEITPADLTSLPFIHPRRESNFFKALHEAFIAEGHTMSPLVEIRQFTGACELVCRGLGVAVVSELDARGYVTRGLDFRPFAPAIPHRLSLVRPVHQHPSMLTLEFLGAFEDSLQDLRA